MNREPYSPEAAAAILREAREAIASAADEVALGHLRSHYLGRNSLPGYWRQSLRDLSAGQRREIGSALGELQRELQQHLQQRREQLLELQLERELAAQVIDVSLPGRGADCGGLHPVTLMQNRICKLLGGIGFRVETGPEIEDEYHNFTALNIPAGHPAREMHDTFYLAEGQGYEARLLLRTHTSPVQIHSFKKLSPPFQIICPGRVYRCDMDLTHTPMFHQVEGLWIDKSITFADLYALVSDFLRSLFARSDLKVRFRPSYFPFTEPSAEVDIALPSKGEQDQQHSRLGKGSGWLEVMGCGMVNPRVLEEAGLDPDEWNGIAFGLGVERLAMLYYGIDDLRMLYNNDLRFLQLFHTA